jgi:quinol monooxygenase YgiN
MAYVVTYIEVQADSTLQATRLIEDYRKTSSGDEGNSEIEVLQEIGRKNRFVLMEAWRDELSLQAHQLTERTAQFRSQLREIHNSPDDQRVHHNFAVGPVKSSSPETLFIVTHVDVPPPRREETEILLKSEAEQSRSDPGNTRYDVFQQSARLNHFTVVSAWDKESSFSSHERTPHTRAFREALGPMLGALYDERLYKTVIS